MDATSDWSDEPIVKRSKAVYKQMRDPAALRNYYKMKILYMKDMLDVAGSSPTDIFVGRYGYPKVFVGPMVPAEFGNTSILSTPELWRNKSISDIFDMRLKLIRGIFVANIWDVEKNKMTEHIRDLALSDKPVDSEIKFSSKLNARFDLNDDVEPFGMSAKISRFDVNNIKANKKIENMYRDTDSTATNSVIELYEKKIPISRINRGLSSGLFGIGNKRKFVPTRWGITAVDDTLSKYRRELIKDYDEIDHIEIYYNVFLDNRWMVIFMPGEWNYEMIEAWYPHTVWNKDSGQVSVYSSSEGYKGRSKYAEIGGGYYAARLAVTERLEKIKRQARILILREIHEGYSMPVGVWNVREHVRETLDGEPVIFNESKNILNNVSKRLEVTSKEWIRNSTILKSLFLQKKISSYVK